MIDIVFANFAIIEELVFLTIGYPDPDRKTAGSIRTFINQSTYCCTSWIDPLKPQLDCFGINDRAVQTGSLTLPSEQVRHIKRYIGDELIFQRERTLRIFLHGPRWFGASQKHHTAVRKPAQVSVSSDHCVTIAAASRLHATISSLSSGENP